MWQLTFHIPHSGLNDGTTLTDAVSGLQGLISGGSSSSIGDLLGSLTSSLGSLTGVLGGGLLGRRVAVDTI